MSLLAERERERENSVAYDILHNIHSHSQGLALKRNIVSQWQYIAGELGKSNILIEEALWWGKKSHLSLQISKNCAWIVQDKKSPGSLKNYTLFFQCQFIEKAETMDIFASFCIITFRNKRVLLTLENIRKMWMWLQILSTHQQGFLQSYQEQGHV